MAFVLVTMMIRGANAANAGAVDGDAFLQAEIAASNTVVIVGETGSGKTTQVRLCSKQTH